MDSVKDIGAKWRMLLFGVRRSTRYHLRRRQFFDRLGIITNFLVIISGGTVVSLVSADNNEHKGITIFFGACVGLLAAMDLVVGFSTRARDHHDLARDFMGLERRITSEGNKPTEETLATFTNRRLEIEENEPPILRVLDVQCHNELVKALGLPIKYRVKIRWYQRIFAQIIDINADSIAVERTMEQVPSSPVS